MAKRNALFRKAQELLENDGFSQDEAINMAYKSLIEIRSGSQRKKGHHAGGQPGTPPVRVVEDVCLGALPDCTGESNNPFRRINGTCNNLGGSPSGRELRLKGGSRPGGTFVDRCKLCIEYKRC